MTKQHELAVPKLKRQISSSRLRSIAWKPRVGAIELTSVSMRYSPGLPLVLKDVTLKIEHGQKIGVVGRTGAGKSSLVLAVFRMVELDGGSITIDGKDITTINARELRAGLGMIPQDTFMFSGSIRMNLDVTGIAIHASPHTLLSYTPLTLLSYTPLTHSPRTVLSYTLSYTPLLHSSHTLLSYTPLTHSSHTLL
jgi:ABC-type transport system involved in cytochrome bd biosynthesis fused ATPase/permease subunit